MFLILSNSRVPKTIVTSELDHTVTSDSTHVHQLFSNGVLRHTIKYVIQNVLFTLLQNQYFVCTLFPMAKLYAKIYLTTQPAIPVLAIIIVN